MRDAQRRRAAQPVRMPGRKRAGVYVILIGLWLTGGVWLLLDQFFQQRGEFGAMPNPWQPPLLLLHGVVAIVSLYLLGWISARHVLRWWPSHQRRLSGSCLAALLTVLTVSGFALFFLTDDRWQHTAALSHDIVGIGITVFAIQHWFFARRRDMRSAASRP